MFVESTDRALCYGLGWISHGKHIKIIGTGFVHSEFATVILKAKINMYE